MNEAESGQPSTGDNNAGLMRMLSHRRRRAGKDQSNVVYTGQWHDSIPRRLILDPTLKPVEKLIWQIIRTHIGQPGEEGAWPSIRRLARLASVSRPTVQNAVDVLQAARWLHAIRRVRDESGAVIGNYYLLHAAPLPIAETMLVAPDYLYSLREMAALTGPSKKRVRAYAIQTLESLHVDAASEMRTAHAVFQQLRENLSDNQGGIPDTGAADVLEHAASVDNAPSEVPDAIHTLEWPDSIKAADMSRAVRILQEAPAGMSQDILNALAAARDVRQPLSYLGRLVERARQGLFVVIGPDQASSEAEQAKDALRITLKHAQDALATGKQVTIKGKPIEYICGAVIQARNQTGAVNAYSAMLKAEDIEITD